MKTKETLNSLNPYVPGKPVADVLKEYGLTSAVKLASNENPYGYSKQVKETIVNGLDHLEIYPDGGAVQLKAALAKFYNLAPEQFLVGSGLDEVIQIVSRALLNTGDSIIIASPSFPQYAHHAVIEGATVKKVPVIADSGLMDLESMLAAIDDTTKIVWLCNPNNPTGTYIKQNKIEEFLARVPEDVLVISDEAYYDYVTAEEQPTSLPFLEKYPNLMIMRTFSKAYGLAGIRVGYAIIPKNLGRFLDIARLPFNCHSLAQKAAITALKDQDFVAFSQKENKIEREKWEAFLEDLGLHYYHTETNFIFFDTKQDDKAITQELLSKGFIIRGGLKPGWLRVTIGKKDDNLRIQDELKQILG